MVAGSNKKFLKFILITTMPLMIFQINILDIYLLLVIPTSSSLFLLSSPLLN